MFSPLPRGSVVQSHANDVLPFAQKAFTNPKCWAEASSQLQMSGDAKSKSGWKKNAREYKLFHVTRGLHHQHHPRHRWVTEDAQKRAAAASPAEQTLLQQRVRAAPLKEEWGERREGEPVEECVRERENEGEWSPPVAEKRKPLMNKRLLILIATTPVVKKMSSAQLDPWWKNIFFGSGEKVSWKTTTWFGKIKT